MRVVYLTNNLVGLQILQWLSANGGDVVALGLHPEGERKYGDEIIEVAGVTPDAVMVGKAVNDAAALAQIEAFKPDICFSVLFGFILDKAFIDLFPRGVINLHPAYLPHNRGQYPNIWSIINETPAGVTLHYVDEGIDTGEIIAQREVPVEAIDTGKTLYHKLEAAAVELFKESWPAILANNVESVAQPKEEGSFYRTKDVEPLAAISLEKEYRAKDLINILRALTFPPYRGAHFTIDGKQVNLRLELEYEDDDSNN